MLFYVFVSFEQRLLNGATARFYRLTLVSEKTRALMDFYQIGVFLLKPCYWKNTLCVYFVVSIRRVRPWHNEML